jgi:hypothetical protein
MNKKWSLLLAILLILVLVVPTQAAVICNSTIISVVKDESVTLRAENFPADDTFNVYMGYNGTYGVNGYLVSKVTTGDGGNFLAKFYIPDQLKGEDIIAIRLESDTNSKYFAYNFFYNKTATSASGCTSCTTTTTPHMPDDFPRFEITAFETGQYISIQTKYLPAYQRFSVLLKDGASTATQWYEVDGFESGEGNILNMTFPIPEELKYKVRIAVKLYSLDTGWFYYNLAY